MADEIIDIVTENNEVVGQARRRVVHQSGQWHRGVHLFLFDPSGRLLVQQRSNWRDKFPSTLDCSVSEHLKPGEGYVDAAVRGLHEELGIGPVELRRRIRFRMIYGPGDHMVSELYEGSVTPELVTFDPNEVEQIAYYTLRELDVWLEHEPDAFSPWFAQLLRWYGGKASQLVAMKIGEADG